MKTKKLWLSRPRHNEGETEKYFHGSKDKTEKKKDKRCVFMDVYDR